MGWGWMGFSEFVSYIIFGLYNGETFFAFGEQMISEQS